MATGESHTLEEFVALAFAAFDLDWKDHVDIDPPSSAPPTSPAAAAILKKPPRARVGGEDEASGAGGDYGGWERAGALASTAPARSSSA